MTPPNDAVFLFGVDNTQRDNDHVVADRDDHLRREFGRENEGWYRKFFETLRVELCYANSLGAWQSYRLGALISACMERDPGEIYGDLTREFGEPAFERVNASATPTETSLRSKLTPAELSSKHLADDSIQSIIAPASGTDAGIGSLNVIFDYGWFTARPSGTEGIYENCAESFQGADHLRRVLAEALAIASANLAVEPE